MSAELSRLMKKLAAIAWSVDSAMKVICVDITGFAHCENHILKVGGVYEVCDARGNPVDDIPGQYYYINHDRYYSPFYKYRFIEMPDVPTCRRCKQTNPPADEVENECHNNMHEWIGE